MRKALLCAAAALLLVLPVSLALSAEDAAPEPTAVTSSAEPAPPISEDGLLAGDETPLSLTGCSAEKNCDCSPEWVSCTGSTSCTVGASSVTCDGNQVNCPDPNIPPPCMDPVGWCACRDGGGHRPTCTILYC